MFNDNIFHPVGKLVLYFGELESQLCELVALLCQCEFDIAHALVAPLSLSQQIDTLRGLVDHSRKEQRFSAALLKELGQLADRINAVLGPRNTLVHGMILKTDKGEFFVRFAGRPPGVKKLLPADPAVIEKLAEDTLDVARLANRLIFKIQGLDPIEREDITVPVVSVRRGGPAATQPQEKATTRNADRGPSRKRVKP
jgi:hypothetical protein